VKLVLSIIHDEDAFLVMDDLSDRGFSVTKLASTGGFLRSGNTTLICGVNDDKVNEVINIIEKKCKSRKQITSISSAQSSKDNYIPFPVEVTVGGATIFVLGVEEFKKI
jgi:uncharacterized protein YaaQ